MWERLIGWLRLLWDSGRETQENTAAIQELNTSQEVLIELVRSVLTQQELLRKDNEALRQEIQRQREKHADELEKMNSNCVCKSPKNYAACHPAQKSDLAAGLALLSHSAVI